MAAPGFIVVATCPVLQFKKIYPATDVLLRDTTEAFRQIAPHVEVELISDRVSLVTQALKNSALIVLANNDIGSIRDFEAANPEVKARWFVSKDDLAAFALRVQGALPAAGGAGDGPAGGANLGAGGAGGAPPGDHGGRPPAPINISSILNPRKWKYVITEGSIDNKLMHFLVTLNVTFVSQAPADAASARQTALITSRFDQEDNPDAAAFEELLAEHAAGRTLAAVVSAQSLLATAEAFTLPTPTALPPSTAQDPALATPGDKRTREELHFEGYNTDGSPNAYGRARRAVAVYNNECGTKDKPALGLFVLEFMDEIRRKRLEGGEHSFTVQSNAVAMRLKADLEADQDDAKLLEDLCRLPAGEIPKSFRPDVSRARIFKYICKWHFLRTLVEKMIKNPTLPVNLAHARTSMEQYVGFVTNVKENAIRGDLVEPACMSDAALAPQATATPPRQSEAEELLRNLRAELGALKRDIRASTEPRTPTASPQTYTPSRPVSTPRPNFNSVFTEIKQAPVDAGRSYYNKFEPKELTHWCVLQQGCRGHAWHQCESLKDKNQSEFDDSYAKAKRSREARG